MKQTLLKKTGYVLRSIRYRLWKTPHERVIAEWNACSGDKTYRLDYQLSDKSVVLDLGGYEGQWASDIYARSCCTVIVFEPVPIFAAKLRSRFQRNPKIRIVEAAVGDKEGELTIYTAADASSVFEVAGSSVLVKQIALIDYLNAIGVVHVDLVKMNIEGGEYELLEALIKQGAIKRFRNLQIQFHRCVPNHEQRVTEIRQQLACTHVLSWQFPYVWENWAISDNS